MDKENKNTQQHIENEKARGISRRDLLKGAAAGAVTISTAGMLNACSPKVATPEASVENSEALQSAVHPWLSTPDSITDFVSEDTYDIVVVGAGMAGCTAAQAAAEAGASVICVEKFEGITAHGTDIGAIGTKLQQEEGIEIDKDMAARLMYQWSQSEANYHLIRTFIEKSGEVFNYYYDMAMEKGLTVVLNTQMTARSDWDTLEDRFKQFRTAHKFAPIEQSQREDGQWVTANFIDMMVESAQSNGAVFSFNTKAEQLVKEGERVTAVIVSDEEGYKKLNATKGVIMATGGIGGNNEMLECWQPIALRADTNCYTPVGGNTGDGIVMGMWIGAARSKSSPAPIIHPVNLGPMGPGFDTTWLSVNRDGKRYCCEVGWEPIVTNARMNTPGNKAWAIFDSHYPEHAQRQEPIKSASFMDGLEENVEAAVTSGQFFKGETLEELAEAIGVPAETLQDTVDNYNEACDSGEDKQFGVPPRFLSSVKDGPFYASPINAWLLALPYGLHVNQNSQVCDGDDNPIEGLFAIGNTQGDFFANTYPVTLPGTSHGRCMTFGRLVGQALANDTTIEGYSVI